MLEVGKKTFSRRLAVAIAAMQSAVLLYVCGVWSAEGLMLSLCKHTSV